MTLALNKWAFTGAREANLGVPSSELTNVVVRLTGATELR